jgi:hypothetical protein
MVYKHFHARVRYPVASVVSVWFHPGPTLRVLRLA